LDKIDQADSLQLVEAPSEHLFGGWIGVGNPTACVQQKQRVDRMRRDGSGQVVGEQGAVLSLLYRHEPATP
jgi:hypothetical protein